MRKVILLIIGCFACISIQAQSISAEDRTQSLIDSKIESITSKANFTPEQKEFLVKYVTNTIQTRANTSVTTNSEIEDVNMDTFFTKEQFLLIKKELSGISMVTQSGLTPASQGGTAATKKKF